MKAKATRLRIDAGHIEYAWFEPDQQLPTRPLTICLLHEGLGCVALWRDFPQALAEQTRCRVFAWSRLGYGNSDPVTLPRTANYMHEDALQHLGPVLDGAGIGDCVLLGHSDGASIAAIYAGGVRDRRVKAVILMAPHFFCEDVSVASIREARKAWDTGKLRTSLAKYHGKNVTCAFLGWNDAWQLPEFADWNLTGYLGQITQPVLAIQGKDDAYGTDDQVHAVTEHCRAPNEVILLDDCGHAPHQDQPMRTLREVERWVATHCE